MFSSNPLKKRKIRSIHQISRSSNIIRSCMIVISWLKGGYSRLAIHWKSRTNLKLRWSWIRMGISIVSRPLSWTWILFRTRNRKTILMKLRLAIQRLFRTLETVILIMRSIWWHRFWILIIMSRIHRLMLRNSKFRLLRN